MWNRRKDEETPTKPSSMVPTQAELTREGIPLSTTPTRLVEPGGGSAAAVGKSVVVKGEIYSREDLFVDGEVDGSVEVQEHRLTIGPNGRVKANVTAREVVIRGTVHGDIHAGGKVEICREAKVTGDLTTSRIVIEDGAYFKGNVDIVQPVTARPPASTPEPKADPEPVIRPLDKLDPPKPAAARAGNQRS